MRFAKHLDVQVDNGNLKKNQGSRSARLSPQSMTRDECNIRTKFCGCVSSSMDYRTICHQENLAPHCQRGQFGTAIKRGQFGTAIKRGQFGTAIKRGQFGTAIERGQFGTAIKRGQFGTEQFETSSKSTVTIHLRKR